jgi:hypothetical protein
MDIHYNNFLSDTFLFYAFWLKNNPFTSQQMFPQGLEAWLKQYSACLAKPEALSLNPNNTKKKKKKFPEYSAYFARSYRKYRNV